MAEISMSDEELLKYAVEAIPFVRTINRDLDPTEIAEFYERTF